MPWLNNLVHRFTHKDVDVAAIQGKIELHSATNDDLLDYVTDIEHRTKQMVQDLQSIYKKYEISFTGFRSLEMACDFLRSSIKNGKEEVYNNLIKIEPMVTSEQQRHVALISMAVTSNGKRVLDQIKQDPESKQKFVGVFGERDASGQMKGDGAYQRLASEIHKLSEYILLQKNKIYH
ncbi:MAG TPA: hypothetical protein VLG38_06585 [Gammaproteobacteria bacterium]|nr:hypothetical protein [Gammaproteobacteria bacterium]